jgi:hypothetical protein
MDAFSDFRGDGNDDAGVAEINLLAPLDNRHSPS